MSIQTEIDRIVAAKSVIKDWLESEDVTVDDGATITAMAEIISSLKLEDGNMGGYGTCSTAAETVAKTVTVDSDSFALETGASVRVKFSYSNTASSPTLNVNGTGAKAIKRYGTTAVSTSANTSWNAGSVVELTYDGTYWIINNFLNTTYSSMTVAEYEAGTGTTARIITPARLKAAILTWAAAVDHTHDYSDTYAPLSHTHGAACEKDVDTDVVSGSANLPTSDAVYRAIANVAISGGGISTALLWENSSPAATFAAQTVDYSETITENDLVAVCFRQNVDSDTEMWAFGRVGKTSRASMGGRIAYATDSYSLGLNRVFTPSTDSIYFNTGSRTTTISNATSTGTVLIPQTVIAFKGVFG